MMSNFPPEDVEDDDPRARLFDCTDNYKDHDFTEDNKVRPQPGYRVQPQARP